MPLIHNNKQIINRIHNGREMCRKYHGSRLVWEKFFKRLPSSYQEVEYLESTGEQYIDLGFKLKNTYKTYIKYEAVGTNAGVIFGSRGTKETIDYSPVNSYQIARFPVSRDIETIDIFNNFTADHSRRVTTPSYKVNDVYLSEEKIVVNGETLITMGKITPFETITNACLFANPKVSLAQTPIKVEYTQARVYSLLVIDENNNIKYNFVPCYRKSDKKPGMYETISKRFFTNGGTGEFLLPQRLPSEYQEVEYIESSKTQIIDTGISGSKKICFEIKASMEESEVYSHNGCFAGATNLSTSAGATNRLYIGYGSVKKTWVWGQGTANGEYTSSVPFDKNTVHTFINDANNGYVQFDNEERINVNTSWNTSIPKANICLFGDGIATASGQKGYTGYISQKLYYCKIYENEELIAHFIPVRRNDGTLGMYDLIRCQFFTNAGTGEFIAPGEAATQMLDED